MAVRDHIAATLLVSCALAGSAAADDRFEVVPNSHLIVVRDAQSHYIAFTIAPPTPDRTAVSDRFAMFAGDGKTFRRQRMIAIGSQGDLDQPTAGSWKFWEPRMEGSELDLVDGHYTLRCGDREVPFTALAADEASALAAMAAFKQPAWTRALRSVARAEDGVYYVVDGPIGEARRDLDVHVYSGKRGAMRPLKIKEANVDSSSSLYITDRGTLKVSADGAAWIIGSKKTALTPLSLDDLKTDPFVYGELGVYPKARLGTPCDEP